MILYINNLTYKFIKNFDKIATTRKQTVLYKQKAF